MALLYDLWRKDVIVLCPACNASVPLEALYCVTCGIRLPKEAQHTAPTAEGLGAVVLGRGTAAGESIRLETNGRLQGMYVIGLQGSGKTSFLLNLMLQDAAHQTGFAFIDPHGDAIDTLLARLPDAARGRVILLDASNPTCRFGINFYQVANPRDELEVALRAEQAVDVFKKLWGEGEQASWGPRLENLLRNISHTLIANPGYTLADVPKLLTDEHFRIRLVANLENPDVQGFWQEEYDPQTDREQREHRESTLNKVRAFLNNPMVKSIVGQSRSTIDFRAEMDRGSIVLVKLPRGAIGNQGVNLVGSVIVGLIANCAYSRQNRREEERRPFFLYADEYQRFATPDFAELLEEARKYRVGTITAHQNRWQLKREGAAVAAISAVNIVVFQVNGEDGKELALQFDRTPGPVRPLGHVKRDVVGHLLSEGYNHPFVEELVTEYLEPLVDASRQHVGRDSWGRRLLWERTLGFQNSWTDIVQDTYTYDPEQLKQPIRDINAYLYQCMAQGRENPAAVAPMILTQVSEYFGFSELCGGPESARELVRLWREWEEKKRVRLAAWSSLPEEERRAAWPSLQEEMQWEEEHYRPWLSSRARGRRPERFKRELYRAKLFLNKLSLAGMMLAQKPILTQSGQLERELPQTYTDRTEEIANSLTRLPARRAKTKITAPQGLEEHTIDVLDLPPAVAKHELDTWLSSLQAWMQRRGYCQPKSAVDEEIRRRQETDGDPPRRRRGGNI